MASMMILSAMGFLLSLYALVVEQRLQRNQFYKASCDISAVVSCSTVLLSPYASLFGVSNAAIGMIFYTAMMVCAWYSYTELLRYGALVSVFASVLFSYILYFKIHVLCPICTLIYVVNVLLVYCAYVM